MQVQINKIFCFLLAVFINMCVCFTPTTSVVAAGIGNVILTHIERYQSMESAKIITNDILYYSGVHDIDPLLITALFTQESGFNMAARSETGAIGIAQLQPETARSLGVDPYDIHRNIQGGISYFSCQQRAFKKYGAWYLTYAIAAYNAGPGAIYDNNGVPPYRETQKHVDRIYAIHQYLLRQMGN